LNRNRKRVFERDHTEIRLLVQSQHPRKYSLKIADPHNLRHDFGQVPGELRLSSIFTGVQIVPGSRLKPNLQESLPFDLNHLAGGIAQYRRFNVLDRKPGQFPGELEYNLFKGPISPDWNRIQYSDILIFGTGQIYPLLPTAEGFGV
jgi:hypothetical protein